MRFSAAALLIVPLLLAAPSYAAVPPGADAAQHSDDALWAEWEAQARLTGGDYDGAIQAEQQATAEWQQAEQASARSSRR
jgi:hypothetical protein